MQFVDPPHQSQIAFGHRTRRIIDTTTAEAEKLRLFAPDGGKRHLRLDSRAVVPARSSRHALSRFRHLSQIQAEISLILAVQISRASSQIHQIPLVMSNSELPTPADRILLGRQRHSFFRFFCKEQANRHVLNTVRLARSEIFR